MDSTIFITKDTLFAIKQSSGEPEYWRVPWAAHTIDATFQDVSSTLKSKTFHLVLTNDLTPLDETSTDISSSYSKAISSLGYLVLSTRIVGSATQLEDLISKEPTSLVGDLKLGSLEDLPEQTPRNYIHLIKLICIILSGILVAWGAWLLFGQKVLGPSDISETPSPIAQTPTPSVIASPTPTPIVPSPNNQDYQVQIQNGSGIVGLAGKLSAAVEAKGFVVKGVGNADNYDYEHSVIKVKKSTPKSVVTTIQDLIVDSAWDDGVLPDTSPYDVVIIIGQESALAN